MPAFIGWRINAKPYGFPEYYFDNSPSYWRRYVPGKNVLLVQDHERELKDQTLAIERSGYCVTGLWRPNEVLELLLDYFAWDFLVINEKSFNYLGPDIVQILAKSPRKLRWVISCSISSTLGAVPPDLMKWAKLCSGAVFIHQARAVEELRRYFGRPYALRSLEEPREGEYPALLKLKEVGAGS